MYTDAFLARLAERLRPALPLWGLPAETPALLAVSENATFRAGPVVLRVHRAGYHTAAEIRSELAWIEAVVAAGVVDTPRPVPTRDGRLLVALDDEAQRVVVAFEFMPGREPTPADADLPRWFARLGALTARLHAHARTWPRPPGFVRKVWDFDAMLGTRPLWGDFRDAIGLSARGRPLLERTAAALRERLARYGTGERFGLVHADLRLANLLVDGDRLGVIDYDDCGVSWYGYDFAAAVSFMETDAVLPELMAAWVAGYRTVAPFAAEDEAMLPTFVMLRRMLLTAWLATHAETPTGTALGPTYTAGTLAMADAFLAAA